MAGTLRTDYARASIERLGESRHLITEAAYPGAIYLAGLATESILKAFIDRKGEEIKGHNLEKLAATANIARRLKTPMRRQVDAAITEAASIWRNLFRYSSSADLDRMGKELNVRFEVSSRLVRYAQVQGDPLKEWAERLYNLSALIVQEGYILWQSQQP